MFQDIKWQSTGGRGEGYETIRVSGTSAGAGIGKGNRIPRGNCCKSHRVDPRREIAFDFNDLRIHAFSHTPRWVEIGVEGRVVRVRGRYGDSAEGRFEHALRTLPAEIPSHQVDRSAATQSAP